MVGVRHQAVTQVKQIYAGSVLRWVTAVSPGGTSGGTKVKEMGIGKKRGREKRGWGYVKGDSRTGGTTNKEKKKIYIYIV